MLTFLGCFSMAYIATTLGVTGLQHLAHHGAFREILRQHGLLPAALVTPTAVLVTALELLLPAGAVIALAADAATTPAAYITGGSAGLLGLAFLLYILRLLGSPAHALACGCSPFAGETSRLSLLPGAGLALAALLGLAGVAGGGAASLRYATGAFGDIALLAAGYGTILAVLVICTPEALRIDARREGTWMA